MTPPRSRKNVYVARLLLALDRGSIDIAGALQAQVVHDDECSRYLGLHYCDCPDPEIYFVSENGRSWVLNHGAITSEQPERFRDETADGTV